MLPTIVLRRKKKIKRVVPYVYNKNDRASLQIVRSVRFLRTAKIKLTPVVVLRPLPYLVYA